MKKNRVVPVALLPLLVVSCTATTAPPADQAARPVVRAETREIAREVRLHIDPVAGTIRPETPARLLAVLEHEMALDFDVANLRNEAGRTRFTLVARNRGDGVTGLQFRTTGERTLLEPAQPVVLGNMAPGDEAMVTLTFDNPAGTAFTTTLWLQATLTLRGSLPSTGGTAGTSSAPSPTPTATPTPAPTAVPATPTPAPTAVPATPTPTATGTPSPAPTATPAPLATANPTTPPGDTPNPGPFAARGRILMNGRPSFNPISLSLVRTPGWSAQTVTTDAQGWFGASGLEAGEYLAYFYNETSRERIGYWRSRAHKVDASTGAAFPTVDFYQKGLMNDPPMDARRSFPITFSWIPQTQTVDYYRFRLHSNGGRSFTLIYQSARIPGTATSWTWDGSGTSTPLSSTNRYFWGLFWDAGAVGEGGNLYQAIYFNP